VEEPFTEQTSLVRAPTVDREILVANARDHHFVLTYGNSEHLARG
jgi:hypothetical protein